jgi:type I restriction enzyme, S subunit
MNINTPKGWISCEIGEVAKIISGATPPSKDLTNFDDEGGIPWITPADLSKYKDIYIDRGRRNLSEKGFSACSAVKIPPGSVLFSSRAPVGYVVIASNEVTTNQGFKSFVLPDEIDSRFIYFYLRLIKPIAEMMSTGTTFKELSGSSAAKLPLIIAPLNEQKRIADKLDRLLAKVDNCRERLDQISSFITHFRQSILNAAISGKLSEDWRNEQGLLNKWQKVKLSEVATSRLGKMLDKLKNQGDLVPYLRNTNVRWFDFDLSDVKELRASKEEISSLFVRKGDVLICEGGEPGRCAIWKGDDDVYVYQKALHRVRVSDQLSQEWLCYCIKVSADSGNLSNLFSGTTIKHLTSIAFKQFELELPPINEQYEIVRQVEKLFDFADRLEARYQTARAQIDKLTPALLDKAFKGELVPQDPADEPASVLLAKIQQARANPETTTSKQPKTPRKPSIPKVKMLTRSTIQPSHLADILKNSGSLTAEALWNASKLSIDDFYDQLKAEELQELLKEVPGELSTSIRLLEAI